MFLFQRAKAIVLFRIAFVFVVWLNNILCYLEILRSRNEKLYIFCLILRVHMLVCILKGDMNVLIQFVLSMENN